MMSNLYIVDRRFFISKVVALLTLCIVTVAISKSNQVEGFHLSFSRRLLRSANNPQLNPASTLIRPIECRNANNHSEVGICMFSIDCMQNKGVPLSVCKHNYFVGTCCKLPDYNNFVGIVYDLRDTETNQILEARRILSPLITKLESTTKALQPSNETDIQATTVQSIDSETTLTKLQHDATTSIPQTVAIVSTIESTKSSSKLGEKLDERYIISSTSLFTTSTPQPIPHSSLQSRPQQGSILAKIKTQSSLGESARNADGLIPQSIANLPLDTKQQQVVIPGELDSFQIQTTASDNVSQSQYLLQRIQNLQTPTIVTSESKLVPNVESTKQQNSSYELLKDDSLDVIGTITSAHSAPSSIQQQFSGTLVEQSKKPIVLLNEDEANHQSVYLIEDTIQPHTSNIVFATSTSPQTSFNLQTKPSTSTSIPDSVSNTNHPQTIINDQEFALTSATVSSDNFSNQETVTRFDFNSTNAVSNDDTARSSIQMVDSTVSSLANNYNPTTIALPSPQQQLSSTSSPFVDLVSSNAAQTTTPFTTSLSTALLPNISSHPYSPTTETTISVIATTEPTPLVPIQSLSSSTSTTRNSSSSSSPTKATSEPASSIANLGQLYSNQHASTPLHHSTDHNTMQQQHRPGLIILNQQGSSLSLHPATKIVSGGSSANNLIPGLSGLQSAILSHIPFKIASGLSSGLSNYLQAAMKPTGQRPLLSSNNAPASQYQSTSNSTSRPSLISTSTLALQSSQPPVGSGIRFPGSVSDSSSTTSTTTSHATNNWLVNQIGTSSSSSVPFSSILSNQQELGRDLQQVCGRPNVSSLQSGEGKKRVARIVGGNQSLFGQWPWMVSLRQLRKGAFLHKCGAALLNENWAITAAHCVENVKASDLLLRLGEFDVSHQDEPYPFIERRVKTVVSHPNFDPKTFEYDLALLRFAEPVKYERNIIPVCVPTGNDSYVDRMATVIGWGRLYEDGPLPDVIQHVDVPIITNNECEKMYKNAGYIEEIPDMFICAGISKGGRDSCEGDSGGPLTMVDHDGRSYLVGIISWGIGCALPSQPGVYTRITAFSGWINQIVTN